MQTKTEPTGDGLDVHANEEDLDTEEKNQKEIKQETNESEPNEPKVELEIVSSTLIRNIIRLTQM